MVQVCMKTNGKHETHGSVIGIAWKPHDSGSGYFWMKRIPSETLIFRNTRYGVPNEKQAGDGPSRRHI